MKGVGQNL